MSQQQRITRREFLRRSRNTTVGAALGVAAPNLFLSRIQAATGESPNEFIRVGFIGVATRHQYMRALMKNAVAVCDVDKLHLATAKNWSKIRTRAGNAWCMTIPKAAGKAKILMRC